MAENKNRGASFLGYFLGLCIVLAIAGACEEKKEYGPVEGGTRWERMEMARGEWRD